MVLLQADQDLFILNILEVPIGDNKTVIRINKTVIATIRIQTRKKFMIECFETKVNQRDCNKCKQRKRHYGKGLCRDCYYDKTKISQPASNTVLNEENNAQEDVPESQPTPWQLPVFFGPKAAADYTPKNWKKGQFMFRECFETRINQCICVDCKLQKRHNSKDRCYECFKTFMRLKRRRSGNTTMELSTNHSIATNDQELEDDDIIHIPGPSHRAPLKRPSTRSQRVQPDNQASTQRQVPAVQPQRPQVAREGAIINAMARTVQINNIEYIELSSGEESDY
ncbi:hypothetical protein M3Y97_00690500 [Aphelenchoides bicaudatus]|nr:hypothetical protein M3Y97_00690500 [Aphelenchoides bicaudatus]